MSGDFLHKRLTFARPPPTRNECLVVRTKMTAAAVTHASWTVVAGGGRCVCLLLAVLGADAGERSATARPEHFQCETLCVSHHTTCHCAEKCGFSAYFGSGGAWAAASRLPFFKGKRSIPAFFRRFRPCAPFDASERGFFVSGGCAACVACPEGNGYSDGMLHTFNPAAASRPLYDHS